MTSKRVLVTGAAGRVGSAVADELLRRGQPVRGFDLVPHPRLSDQVIGNLTDRGALDRAMAGIDTLIHLAATPDDDDFLNQLLPNNVVGVYHTLEAAREAGVKRMILASSGQVVWWERLRAQSVIGVEVQPTPRYWYAALKVLLEAAGRSFAEQFGMQVLAVRLGWCPRTKEQVEEIRAIDWAQDVYLSPGDAGRFFADAAAADGDYRFAVVYATSQPVHWARYDLEPTRRLTGFEPREKWPQGIEVILNEVK